MCFAIKITFRNIRFGTKDCHYITTGSCRWFKVFIWNFRKGIVYKLLSLRTFLLSSPWLNMNLTFGVLWVTLWHPLSDSIDNVLKFSIWFNQQGVLGVSRSNMEVEVVGNLNLLLLLATLPLARIPSSPQQPSAALRHVGRPGVWLPHPLKILSFCLD